MTEPENSIRAVDFSGVKVVHISGGRVKVRCTCYRLGHTGNVHRSVYIASGRGEASKWIREHNHAYLTYGAAVAAWRRGDS